MSGAIPPNQCEIVLVQGSNGSLLGTKKIDGSHIVDVGEVPKIIVNKCKVKNNVDTLTPLTNSKTKETTLQTKMEDQLSPIKRVCDNAGDLNASFDPNETSESTEILRSEVKKFEENLACETSTTCNSTISVNNKDYVESEKSEINDVEEKGKLRIEDIGGGSKDSEILDPDVTREAPEPLEPASEISVSKSPVTISGSMSTEYPPLVSEFTNTPDINTSLLSEAPSTVDPEIGIGDMPGNTDIEKTQQILQIIHS